ncbi:M16 family metallopeptidase [Pannus brasiliensis]|uniref:M16 family metallopeptidase n=1 Tax=Pannus brasiliensis TaxID=1579216 RepID=UPI003BEF25C0
MQKPLQWSGLILATLALALMFRLPAIAQTARHYTELTFPPLPEVQVPKYERYQLKNGMVVYLMEDRSLPLVSGTAMIRTGGRLEPGERTGLAEIAGNVIRTGGTETHPSNVLNQLLEQRAAIVETSIGLDSGSASFNALSEDIKPVFALFADVLRSPAFEPARVELARTQQKGEIARRNDDPDDIASREFKKLIYGDNSPYGRTIEYNTLAKISREDLIEFYRTYVRPDRIILGIVGDFKTADMKALVDKTFGDWQNPPNSTKITTPEATQKNPNGVFVIDRPQLTQSSVLIGHLGGRLDSPDYPALTVLNEILSGFGGRLFNEVRSRQGLAYSVYGVWSGRYDYPGLFVAGGQTRTDATVPFIKAIESEIERVRTEPVTEKELEDAKNSILNSFVFKFENPAQTLSRLMTYEYYGYPSDFIFRYQKAVKETSIEDIQRVAKTYLQPDRLVVLVVGNEKEINPPLSSLGATVRTVKLEDTLPNS